MKTSFTKFATKFIVDRQSVVVETPCIHWPSLVLWRSIEKNTFLNKKLESEELNGVVLKVVDCYVFACYLVPYRSLKRRLISISLTRLSLEISPWERSAWEKEDFKNAHWITWQEICIHDKIFYRLALELFGHRDRYLFLMNRMNCSWF